MYRFRQGRSKTAEVISCCARIRNATDSVRKRGIPCDVRESHGPNWQDWSVPFALHIDRTEHACRSRKTTRDKWSHSSKRLLISIRTTNLATRHYFFDLLSGRHQRTESCSGFKQRTSRLKASMPASRSIRLIDGESRGWNIPTIELEASWV